MWDQLRELIASWGLSSTQGDVLFYSITIVGVILVAGIANWITRNVIVRVLYQLVRRSRTEWDDILLEKKVFSRLSHLVPALVIWSAAPALWPDNPALMTVARRGAEIYLLIAGLLVISALLNAGDAIYRRAPMARRVPITGYVQVIKLLFSIAVGITAVSIAVDRSPWVLLSGFGAITAIVLLVFKDTILGFVAGIQLAANDMVRPGDWIEMPKYGANGEVLEVTLNTVKVRNWDKTVSTIPTYALTSDSFKNWRGMTESGGRRIKRALLLDVNSVHFLTDEQIQRLSKIQILRDYIEAKHSELAEYNAEHNIDSSVSVNGRRMTNLGTFRAYLVAYLRQHPKIHQDMTFLVRQLAPTESGLPLEIYVFSSDQAWANYEAIQADIFDHIFASIGEFGLRPFQAPAGWDIRKLGQAPQLDAAQARPE